MTNAKYYKDNSRKKKILIGVGIAAGTIALFLLTFVISFNLIAKNDVPDHIYNEGELSTLNDQLKRDIQLLEDENEILRTELEAYRGEYGVISGGTTAPQATANTQESQAPSTTAPTTAPVRTNPPTQAPTAAPTPDPTAPPTAAPTPDPTAPPTAAPPEPESGGSAAGEAPGADAE